MFVAKRFAIGLAAAAGLTLAAAPLASAGVPSGGEVLQGGQVCYYIADGVALGNLWVGLTDCVHYPDTNLTNSRTGEVGGKSLGSINGPGGQGIAAAWWY